VAWSGWAARSERGTILRVPPRAKPIGSDVLRAAKLSRVPGVTIAEACGRFDVPKSAVARARREPGSALSLDELALAALSKNGTKTRGALSGLGGIARWLDYINHDACSAEDVRSLLETFVASGHLSIDGERWRLREAWPWAQTERALRG
jgi:hypothetical protein